MASTNSTPSYQIPNGNDPSKLYTFLNIHNAIKLTPTNYLSWKLQVEAILEGHDLFSYVDGSLECPPSAITNDDGVQEPNPNHAFWKRQDRLLFGALIDTLSPNLIPLVSQAKTSAQLWDKLNRTYALPSRGHINQIKDKLNRIVKGNLSISDYMQSLKECVDRLAALGKQYEHEDLIDRVLSCLDDSYQSVIDSVHARDTPISFEELHEKLINKELSIQQARTDPTLPATAFAASTRHYGRSNTTSRQNTQGILPTPNTSPRQPRPFLGKCQWCREQGHVIAHCPTFTQKFPNAHPPAN